MSIVLAIVLSLSSSGETLICALTRGSRLGLGLELGLGLGLELGLGLGLGLGLVVTGDRGDS